MKRRISLLLLILLASLSVAWTPTDKKLVAIGASIVNRWWSTSFYLNNPNLPTGWTAERVGGVSYASSTITNWNTSGSENYQWWDELEAETPEYVLVWVPVNDFYLEDDSVNDLFDELTNSTTGFIPKLFNNGVKGIILTVSTPCFESDAQFDGMTCSWETGAGDIMNTNPTGKEDAWTASSGSGISVNTTDCLDANCIDIASGTSADYLYYTLDSTNETGILEFSFRIASESLNDGNRVDLAGLSSSTGGSLVSMQLTKTADTLGVNGYANTQSFGTLAEIHKNRWYVGKIRWDDSSGANDGSASWRLETVFGEKLAPSSGEWESLTHDITTDIGQVWVGRRYARGATTAFREDRVLYRDSEFSWRNCSPVGAVGDDTSKSCDGATGDTTCINTGLRRLFSKLKTWALSGGGSGYSICFVDLLGYLQAWDGGWSDSDMDKGVWDWIDTYTEDGLHPTISGGSQPYGAEWLDDFFDEQIMQCIQTKDWN